MLALGDTVLIPKPGQDKSHLWVLVTAVNPQSGEVIIAKIKTAFTQARQQGLD